MGRKPFTGPAYSRGDWPKPVPIGFGMGAVTQIKGLDSAAKEGLRWRIY